MPAVSESVERGGGAKKETRGEWRRSTEEKWNVFTGRRLAGLLLTTQPNPIQGELHSSVGLRTARVIEEPLFADESTAGGPSAITSPTLRALAGTGRTTAPALGPESEPCAEPLVSGWVPPGKQASCLDGTQLLTCGVACPVRGCHIVPLRTVTRRYRLSLHPTARFVESRKVLHGSANGELSSLQNGSTIGNSCWRSSPPTPAMSAIQPSGPPDRRRAIRSIWSFTGFPSDHGTCATRDQSSMMPVFPWLARLV